MSAWWIMDHPPAISATDAMSPSLSNDVGMTRHDMTRAIWKCNVELNDISHRWQWQMAKVKLPDTKTTELSPLTLFRICLPLGPEIVIFIACDAKYLAQDRLHFVANLHVICTSHPIVLFIVHFSTLSSYTVAYVPLYRFACQSLANQRPIPPGKLQVLDFRWQ